MVNVCIVCGIRQNQSTKLKGITFHRLPPSGKLRQKWLQSLQLEGTCVSNATRVCSEHFRDGIPYATLGEKFEEHVDPTKRRIISRKSPDKATSGSEPAEESTVNAAVQSSMECSRCSELVQELQQLKAALANTHFGIHSIQEDDSLISYYTGFPTYKVLQSFFEFLGPSVHKLTYWGSNKPETCSRDISRTKLSPMDQLLLTLMRLRFNLEELDLAIRFKISQPTVSRYFITWVSFLYCYLSEIDWWPSTDQVHIFCPSAFRDKYPVVFAIIDATEVYLETPSDLFLQSSTWSNYKSHNTCKFLVACTPNGCICFVSDVYVGSISDVDLTNVSGFLERISKCPGSSIMADRGFTIKETLKKLNVDLNIPPFLEGKKQLSAQNVKYGRQIASLRIHVERAIGRIKNFQILKGVFQLNSARILNRIVAVCAYLTNFQPVLVPPSIDLSGVQAVFLECTASDATDD